MPLAEKCLLSPFLAGLRAFFSFLSLTALAFAFTPVPLMPAVDNRDNSDEKIPRTRELVQRFAAALLEEGQEVTQLDIRQRIYQGYGITASPNLVIDELRKFWTSEGPRLAARLQRQGIPDAVMERVDQLWDEALGAAKSTFQAERSRFEALASDAQSRMETAVAEAEALRQQLLLTQQEGRHRLESLEAAQQQIATLRIEAQERLEELRRLRAETAQQQARYKAERDELKNAYEAELQRLSQAYEAALERLLAAHKEETGALRIDISRQAEIWEGTHNHLMNETSRVRDAARAEAERLGRELRQARDLIDQLRVQRSDAKEEAAELKGRLASTQQQLAKAEAALEQQVRKPSEAIENPDTSLS